MIKTFLLALMSVAFLGCSTGYQTPAAKLTDTLNRYNESVRWRRYKSAAKFVNEAKQQAYLETRRSAGKNRRILDWELISVTQAKINKEAHVLVRFTWQRPNALVVEHTTFKQIWHYSKNRRWFLESQKEVEDAPPPKRKPIETEF